MSSRNDDNKESDRKKTPKEKPTQNEANNEATVRLQVEIKATDIDQFAKLLAGIGPNAKVSLDCKSSDLLPILAKLARNSSGASSSTTT